MAKVQHLSNAPIREALIDIQVNFPENFDFQSLEGFGDAIRDQYPEVGKQMQAEFKLKGEEAKVKSSIISYKFISEDRLQIVQARVEGFTFSRLTPYETWDNLKSEAKRLWDIFVTLFQPEGIRRIACRYINEIEMTHPIDLSEYITAPPPRIEGLPDKLESFFSRIEVFCDDIPTKAIITQTIQQKTEHSTKLLLDIDVFRTLDYPIGGDSAWSGIEEFRTIKNEIFFNSITLQAVERYR